MVWTTLLVYLREGDTQNGVSEGRLRFFAALTEKAFGARHAPARIF
jgi:hypothetical protein